MTWFWILYGIFVGPLLLFLYVSTCVMLWGEIKTWRRRRSHFKVRDLS